jgi:phosphoribosylglycinamide formyltransferase-1
MREDGKVTVLVSGRGSNLKALIQHQSGYHIHHVISDKAAAGGLVIAREADIPTTVVLRDNFDSLGSFKNAILNAARETQPDLVALAGFMVLLQPAFVEAFHGRLINIHPSLLPEFSGLNTHARALEAGASEHGCTVHFVDTGMDTGPLIAQAKVPVLADDTPDTLAARVIVQEHALYSWTTKHVAQGSIRLEGRTVLYSDPVRAEAALKNFITF